MSLLRDIMDESQGVVNDILGRAAVLTNAATGDETSVVVIIRHKVELYQDGMFGGLVSTATFDRANADPKLGDSLQDLETGITYTIEAVKDETPAKLVFIIGER
jgi:hypothetical protein